MRPSSSLIVLLAFIGSSTADAVLRRAACNADNCARAVTGTAKPLLSSRMADCFSFFLTTVTPAFTTVTVTATPSSPPPLTITGDPTTVTVGPTTTSTYVTLTRLETLLYKRQPTSPTNAGAVTVSPSSVPPYASACNGAVRYSSACSCAGIQKSTTTMPAASTVTVTATAAAPPASTVTLPATVATTVTASTTQTEVVTASYEGPTDGFIVPFNDDQCYMEIHPDLTIVKGSVIGTYYFGSWYSCALQCTYDEGCTVSTYKYGTGKCVTYFSVADRAQQHEENSDLWQLKGENC